MKVKIGDILIAKIDSEDHNSLPDKKLYFKKNMEYQILNRLFFLTPNKDEFYMVSLVKIQKKSLLESVKERWEQLGFIHTIQGESQIHHIPESSPTGYSLDDYFYTPQEIRKLKLEKINENR